MEEYLTPEEVAEKLKLHTDSITRLLRLGKMPGYKIAGSWRISPQELETWLQEQANKNVKHKK